MHHRSDGRTCDVRLPHRRSPSPPPPRTPRSSETLAELNHLQGQLSSASSTYSEATSNAAELNAQVAEIADEILHIEQDLLPARQQRAADAASDLYKTHSSNGGTISLLLNAESFADFINLSKYLGTVQDANVSALNELNKLEDELNGKLDELGRAKDQADAELARASEAYAQAQSAAAKVQAKANAEDAAETEIARKAAEQAAQLQAQQDAQQNAANPNGEPTAQPENGGSGNGSQSEQNGGTNTQGNGSGNSNSSNGSGDSGNSGSSNSGSSESTGGWLTGVASYYGIGDGFMAEPPPAARRSPRPRWASPCSTCPLARVCRDSLRGDARSLPVNDRGPYAHGRVIDMQPAVARALNFVSVGVGTVQYRFPCKGSWARIDGACARPPQTFASPCQPLSADSMYQPRGSMKHISFLIKPASSTCNMRCRYCFYADVAEHRETANHGVMDAATIQTVVDRAFALGPDTEVTFAFQGGEPMRGSRLLPLVLRLRGRASRAADGASSHPDQRVRHRRHLGRLSRRARIPRGRLHRRLPRDARLAATGRARRGAP